MMYRQGDVLILSAFIPLNATPEPRDTGRVILAYGEVTGHAHAFVDAHVQKLAYEGAEYLRVSDRQADLTHEEHDTITVAPGDYKIIHQREYTPDAIVRVLD